MYNSGEAKKTKDDATGEQRQLFSTTTQTATDTDNNNVATPVPQPPMQAQALQYVDADVDVSKLSIFYNDVYEVNLPPNHRFPMPKYRMAREQAQAEIAKQMKEVPTLVECSKSMSIPMPMQCTLYSSSGWKRIYMYVCLLLILQLPLCMCMQSFEYTPHKYTN
jgi:hypothetical protein